MARRRLRKAVCFVLLTCAVALFLLGTADGSTTHAGQSSYAARIGVFSDCLSIRNAALKPGAPVTIIRFNSEEENTVSGDTRERRIAARILAKAELVDDCPIWVEDRSLREDSAELSLYTISPESPGMLDSVEFGIGVLSIPPGDETPLDIDGNGVVDTFAKFGGFASLNFEVWGGAIWFGEPLWSETWRYYHGPE
jgi:hypothetical protein